METPQLPQFSEFREPSETGVSPGRSSTCYQSTTTPNFRLSQFDEFAGMDKQPLFTCKACN